MSPPLLHLRDIDLTFGHRPLFAGTELVVAAGDRLALVGRNGSGKSTFLKIAAGVVEPDAGTVWRQPGTTVQYLAQEADFSGFTTVRDFADRDLAATDDPHAGQRLLEALGLKGTENPSEISGGEARRAAIARALAPAPDILLLDEPTNHIDLPTIEWLEGELRSMRSAIVLVSHDRRFLTTLSRATVWLDRGTARRLETGFGAFEDWRDKVFAEEDDAAHKLDRKLAAEADWLRYGVTARRKRNQGRLRRLEALRSERREKLANRRPGQMALAAEEAGVSGKLVIEARTLCKEFDGSPVVKDFSCRIARGDKIGLVGPNGAGKTTLLNLLTGTLRPDSGEIRIGTALEMATLDQRRESLDPTATLADTLTGGGGDQVMVGETPRHVIGYLRDFLFSPDQARTPVSRLSGGERGRLVLARALARPSNLLVLDEPTNDLDLETLDLLQDMLADYSGTLLLVSHDRDFLDRVVTSVIAAEGKGQWIEYAGGYSDMVAQGGGGFGLEKTGGDKKPSTRQPGKKSARPRKMTFKDKHALETLPGHIANLEEQIAALGEKLADTTLFQRDPEGFARAGRDLEALNNDLAASEERWLELELLREEIEADGT